MKKSAGKATEPEAPEPLKIKVDGVQREFDIYDPELPDWIDDKALESDGYPYDKKMKSGDYEKQLEKLQIELVKLQAWQQATGDAGDDPVRRTRRRRQGRHDRRDALLHEPADRAQRGADQADRDRARPMVLSALHRAFSDGRRVRHLRPLLVQPRPASSR